MDNKKYANRLTLLLAATYLISYVTRINFGAVISEMAEATGFGKSALSMSLTGSFVCYGAGQLLSGVLGDMVSPKRLVSLGLGVSSLMNLLIPICKSPWQMLVVWCVNGLAQAFMWPPMVKIMTGLLSEEEYKQAVTKVSWGSSVGTILIYLLAPATITAASWRGVFYVSAALGVLMLVVWNIRATDVKTLTQRTARHSPAKLLLSPMMLLILLAIVLQGMLRDGITTWLPSLISESFGLSNTSSILTGVLLPVFSIVSFQAANWLYCKRIKNPLSCGGFLFGCGTVCALLLYLFFGKSIAASAFLCAALTGCMHGVNLILICMLPAYFSRHGNTAAVSGILNSCTYIGSAVSTYGIAALSENIGWKPTVFLWLLIAMAGSVICFACAKAWQKRFMNDTVPGGKNHESRTL